MNKSHTVCLLLSTLVICLSETTGHADGSRQKAEIVIPASEKSLYETWGFAPAVKIDNVIYVSGVVAVLEGDGSYEERYAKGFKSALAGIDKVLGIWESGGSLLIS